MNNLSSHLLNLLIFNMLAFWGHKYGCVHISSHFKIYFRNMNISKIKHGLSESLSLIKKTNK